MERTYKRIIFTDHALERLRQRNIKQGDAWATLTNSSSSRPAQRKGSYVFYRTYGDRTIEVVASKNEKGEWVVLSVWDKYTHQRRRGFDKRIPLWRKVLKELARVVTG